MRRIVLVLMLGAVLLGCGDDGDGGQTATATATATAPPDVSTTDGLIEFLGEHRDDVGLVVLPATGEPFELNADERFPLASVRKVLIAGAALAAGKVEGTIPRKTVERYYIPGVDRAHEQSGLDGDPLRVADVAAAAISISDNAAADAILQLAGTDATDAWAREQGMESTDPIYPLLGEFGSWADDPEWADKTPPERAQAAISYAAEAQADTITPPPIARQRELAKVSVAGTPGEWAALMRRIGTEGDPQLQDLLNWPLAKNPELRKSLDAYLTKGGNLSGIVTDVTYLEPKGAGGTAVALFLRDLPPEVEAQLAESFTQQQLVQDLATKPRTLAKVRQVLG